MAHALARALTPERHRNALARSLQAKHMLGDRLEDVAARLVTLGSEIAPPLGADIDDRPLLGNRKGRETRARRLREMLVPLRLGEIEPVRRQRVIERSCARLAERLSARFKVILDLCQALPCRVVNLRLEHDRRAWQVFEQGVEAGMEQWQPMLHSDVPPPLADSLVELIVRRRRPESLDITQTKTSDGLGGELQLGDRHQVERMHLVGRALAFRLEAADRLER